MIIASRDGRHRSEWTREEKWRDLFKRLDNMDEEEQKLFFRTMEDFEVVTKAGEIGFDSREEIVSMSAFYHELASEQYEGEIVSLDEFLHNDHYMGAVGNSLYPKWKEDLHSLFNGQYTEAIISGSIGCGKCLDGETEFCDSEHGNRTTLSEVCIGGVGHINVPSFDKIKGKTVSKKAEVRLFGEKFLGTLLLDSGKKIRLSPDHPVLTQYGWKKVGNLLAGDLVATSRELPTPDVSYDIDDFEVEFVAFMLAEGSCSSGNWSFANADEKCLDRFESISFKLWRQMERGSRSPGVTIKAEKGKLKELYPRGTRWIQHKYNLYEKAIHKRVPSCLMGLSNRQLGIFLNRIWACDGYISEDTRTLEITLGSELFVIDIQQLLLRFGIHSRMKKCKKTYTHNGEKRWSWAWRLSVSGVENISLFFEAIGSLLGKEERSLLAMKRVLKARKTNTNVDITPIGKEESTEMRGVLGVDSRKWKKNRIPSGQRMGREKLLKIRSEYGLPEDSEWWPDVFWDKLKSYDLDIDMSPVYDVEVPGTKNFSPNGIIVHNTTFCELTLLRMFYETIMLRDPQSSFGMMPGTEIIFVCFNRDDKLARDVTYGGIRSKMELSPFFTDRCKIGTSETLCVDKGVRLMAVSVRSAKALGRNVMGGIIDETDFLEGSSISGKERVIEVGEKPFAEKLHGSVMRRMKSRYERNGFLPGKLLMSSSAKNKESFTNKRISESYTNPYVFCRDYALYDVKPAKDFAKTRFWVLVGNERVRHKILTDEEYESITPDIMTNYEEQGIRFLHVPDNFRPDFEQNIEDSIRDIGGCVTIAVSPFIQLRDRIYDCIDPTLKHPLRDETWETGQTPSMIWSRIVEQIENRLPLGRVELLLQPLRHPEAQRHVHIDLSLGKQDCAGICIGHVVGMVDVERRTEDGHQVAEQAPLIEIDLLLQIKAPPNGEIDIGAVRALVYHFVDRGYSFNFASMDSFQSAESLQKFRAQGINAEKISVDATFEPYDYLKLAIYEGRLSMYEYPIVLKELEKLQRDVRQGMVIHPPNGSKDVSDSLAGVVFSLSTKLTHRAPMDVGVSDMDMYEQDDEWIRATMQKKGKKAPVPSGNTPTGGSSGPLIVSG